MRERIRIAIACMAALMMTAASARAQTTYRETGSVTVGSFVVWVRGTNTSAVELFVGRGFRDAFARAHEMDAAKLQQWIDSVRTLAPLTEGDSSAMGSNARVTTLGADVAMMRSVGGAYSGLRLLVSGEDPIQMAEPTARDFIAALDSAAHLTRELSVPPPSILASYPTPNVVSEPETPKAAAPPAPVVAVVAAPAPSVVVAVPAPATPKDSTSQAPVTTAVLSTTPSRPAPPLIGVKPPEDSAAASPVAPAASAMGPTTTEAPPELVLSAPKEPVILVASRVDIMPLPMSEVIPPAPVHPAPKVDPSLKAQPSSPAVAVATLSATPAAPATPVPDLTPTPAHDAVVAPHLDVPADKLIHTPLGPFTIPGALLGDRDKQAQYCYTQLGLKYTPDLKGEITVKLAVGGDGAVQDAVVTKRTWQGISAGEVEACVRALAHDWTFASTDPSLESGAKLLTFSFAP